MASRALRGDAQRDGGHAYERSRRGGGAVAVPLLRAYPPFPDRRTPEPTGAANAWNPGRVLRVR